MKVAGEVNPADLFTKHLESRNKLDQVVGLFGCRFADGRAATAPMLKSDAAAHIIDNKSKRDYTDIYIMPNHTILLYCHISICPRISLGYSLKLLPTRRAGANQTHCPRKSCRIPFRPSERCDATRSRRSLEHRELRPMPISAESSTRRTILRSS